MFKYLYFKLFLKWKAFTGMEQKEKYLYQTLGDLFLTQLIWMLDFFKDIKLKINYLIQKTSKFVTMG